MNPTIATPEQQRTELMAPYANPNDEMPTTMQLTNMQTSSLIMSGDAMARIFKFAEMMAMGAIATPVHLRGNPSDCLAVVMQATQWGMNPFAVAQKTHVVNGALGYEGQLVNAVVQASGAITGGFRYEFEGNKGAVKCRVGAVLRGDQTITWGEWLGENEVTTKNSPLWKTNPKQQLGYLQVKNWARLYAPGAILGVYTPEDFNEPEPQTRDMGKAQVVGATATPAMNDADPAILEAKKEAAKGVESFRAWWAAKPRDSKVALYAHLVDLQAIATKADADRTLQNTAESQDKKAAPAKKEAAAADEPVFTFAKVMERLNDACAKKDQAALDIAADLIGAVADETQRSELEATYDRMTAEIAA